MHLYLIRHGQSYINLRGWQPAAPEDVDAPLTDLGQQQAAALHDWLPIALPRVDAVYVSTMRRARETAQIVAAAYPNAPSIPHHGLRELGNNRTDHTPLPNDSLPLEFTEENFAQYPFAPVAAHIEDCEALAHFSIRVARFLEDIVQKHAGENVLAVTHGGVINAVFGNIFRVGMHPYCELWNANTSLTHFEYLGDANQVLWRLHYQNRTEHLLTLGN